jgi:hypothetical protein
MEAGIVADLPRLHDRATPTTLRGAADAAQRARDVAGTRIEPGPADRIQPT